MKKTTLFISFILFLTSYSQSEKISLNNIKDATYYLASDELEGRDTGSKGIELAAQYLEKKLMSYNIKPFYTTYRDSLLVGQFDAYNLLGLIPGKNDSLKHHPLILSAHYDHVGFDKNATGDDKIINGANDNAASVATILEIGRYFSNHPQERPILIIFFTAEEKGMKGAKHLARKFLDDDISPFALINFEMVGVPMINKDFKVYLTGYNKSNLGDEINKGAGKNVVAMLDKAEKMGLFRASDNYPMYEILKFPAHSISSFDFENYAYYHHIKDEALLMDYKHLTELAESFIPAVIHLCQSETLLYLKE